VQKVSENGHEITLYRIQPGQVCELTTSCLLEGAAELGTAREVVSRQPKEFERHRWVRLSRGKIEILDQPALNSLVARKQA